MSELTKFTIDQFYKNILKKKLLGGKCKKCGKIYLPPRPFCNKCYSQNFDWIEIPQVGTLITYTIIHIAPKQFQDIAPYVVGIVKFGAEFKLPGIVNNINPENLKIGMKLKIDFKTCNSTQTWPKWPRYCFKPI